MIPYEQYLSNPSVRSPQARMALMLLLRSDHCMHGSQIILLAVLKYVPGFGSRSRLLFESAHLCSRATSAHCNESVLALHAPCPVAHGTHGIQWIAAYSTLTTNMLSYVLLANNTAHTPVPAPSAPTAMSPYCPVPPLFGHHRHACHFTMIVK